MHSYFKKINWKKTLEQPASKARKHIIAQKLKKQRQDNFQNFPAFYMIFQKIIVKKFNKENVPFFDTNSN